MNRRGSMMTPVRVRVATGLVIAAWMALMAVPPVILLRGRADWLARLEGPQAQTQWDAFRRDMRRQSGTDGPVQRKVPRSQEPPARVWLRDHLGLAVTAWVLLVGTLGGFFCLFAVGVLWSAGPRGADKPRLPVRGPDGARLSPAEDEAGRESDHEKEHDRETEDADERKHGRSTREGTR